MRVEKLVILRVVKKKTKKLTPKAESLFTCKTKHESHFGCRRIYRKDGAHEMSQKTVQKAYPKTAEINN